MSDQEIYMLVERRRKSLGLTQADVSRLAFGRSDTGPIQSLRRGNSPTSKTLRALCRALELEFYIGPPRSDASGANSHEKPAIRTFDPECLQELQRSAYGLLSVILNAGGDPIPDDLWPVLDALRAGGRDPAHANPAIDDPMQKDATDIDEDVLMVDFAEDVRAAAGSGAMVFEEAADLQVAVPRSVLPRWVSTRGLICIRAAGDSMEPTLSDGHLILLDRSKIEPVDNKVFVIHTDDGLMVKRVRETEDGWMMTSDNPAYKSRRLGEWDRYVGRVAWSGPLPATEAGG